MGTPMLKGESVKAAVYIDRDLLRLLKKTLIDDELSLSEWFRRQARVYVQAKSVRLP